MLRAMVSYSTLANPWYAAGTAMVSVRSRSQPAKSPKKATCMRARSPVTTWQRPKSSAARISPQPKRAPRNCQRPLEAAVELGLQVAAEEELLRQPDDEKLGDDQVEEIGRQGRLEAQAEDEPREGVVQQRRSRRR